MADNLNKKPKLEPTSEPKQSAAPAPAQKAPKQPSFNSPKKTSEQSKQTQTTPVPRQVAKSQAKPKTGIPSGSEPKADPVRKKIMDQGFAPKSEVEKNALLHSETSQKSAPNPSWTYPTDAEKNGNFNYSEARKNGFKHPMTGKESSDLYFKNNYTGPGYSAFEGLQPMKDPNDFSQKFEESFHRFPSEENDSKGRPMIGEQKFYEDVDGNVWGVLMEAKENASDTDTVRDIISRASKESGIDEDRLLNALMFQHFYFGSDFAFSPESNYKKVAERQDKDYEKFLPKSRQPSDRDEREQASQLFGTDLNKNPEPDEEGYSWKKDVLAKPELLEGNIVSMMEQDPDKYDYDAVEGKDYNEYMLRKGNLHNDLVKKLMDEEGFTLEEANKVVTDYLGTEEEDKQAWEAAGYPSADKSESLFTPEEEQEIWHPNNDKERKYVLENMREWMNEADNGPIDENLMMKAYYAADDENGFDTTWSEEDVWNAVEAKYNELKEKQGQGGDQAQEEGYDPNDEPGSVVVTQKLRDFVREYLTQQVGKPYADAVADNLHKDHATADFYRRLMKKKGGK